MGINNLTDASVIILGKYGQLGRALSTQLGDRAMAFDRTHVDLSSPDVIRQLEHAVGNKKYSFLINAAAYTNVDKAESDGAEEAFKVNAKTVAELAIWCAKKQIKFVHFSTDYVFDGSGDTPHQEEDNVAPLNLYGKSKLEGEKSIITAGGDAMIIRTSWVYDAIGKNFFTTILRLLHEKESLNVIDDQFGAPTYAPHLAESVVAVLNQPSFHSGIYHLCNAGQTSWYGFAQAIFALAMRCDSSIICKQIQNIPATEYKLPATRPYNSRLDCSKAASVLGVSLPAWEEGLKIAIRNIYASS